MPLDILAVETSLREHSPATRIVPDGTDRYLILVPVTFSDGDHPVIVLKKQKGEWVLSDEAHTFMRMSDDDMPATPAHVELRNGELVKPGVNPPHITNSIRTMIDAISQFSSDPLRPV